MTTSPDEIGEDVEVYFMIEKDLRELALSTEIYPSSSGISANAACAGYGITKCGPVLCTWPLDAAWNNSFPLPVFRGIFRGATHTFL